MKKIILLLFFAHSMISNPTYAATNKHDAPPVATKGIKRALSGANLNSILENSIYNNNSNGIQLINNGNDDQEVPTIIAATTMGNFITITAAAPDNPSGTTFRLEFFLNQVNRNPITEGQQFIGAIDGVPSGDIVQVMFSSPDVATFKYLSATATNLNAAGDTVGDTSPFTDTIVPTVMPFVALSCISQAIIEKYCIS
jgi:hypothetical protein